MECGEGPDSESVQNLDPKNRIKITYRIYKHRAFLCYAIK